MNEVSTLRVRVIDPTTGRGVSGARFEAIDASGLFPYPVDCSATDPDGNVLLQRTKADIDLLLPGRRVECYLRAIVVGSTNDVILDTQRAGPFWSLDGTETEIVLHAVPSRVLAQLPSLLPFVILGTVFDEEGPMPFEKIIDAGNEIDSDDPVRVARWERELASGEPGEASGEADVDGRGRFLLTYEPASLRVRANVVLRAITKRDTENEISFSEVRCNAPPSIVLDLVRTGHTWKGAPAFDATLARLDEGGYDAAALAAIGTEDEGVPEHRERLACALGVERAEVDAISRAHAIADGSGALPVELAYALVRRGMGTDRATFFPHSRSAAKAAFAQAVADNVVSQRYSRATHFDAAMLEWTRSAAAWALEARGSGERAGLLEILTAGEVSSSGDRTSFAEQLFAWEGTIADFWATGLTGFDSTQKAKIQRAFQVCLVGKGHQAFLTYMAANVGTFPTLVSMCAKSAAEWKTDVIIGASVGYPADIPGATTSDKQDAFAEVIAGTLAAAFPMASFRERVADSSEHAQVKTFFTANSDFDFTTERLTNADIAAYVEANVTNVVAKKRLFGMERLFRAAPRQEHVAAMLDAGYFSASEIKLAGPGKFAADVSASVDDATAHMIYEQACHQAGGASAILAKWSPAFHTVQVRALANHLTPAAAGGDIAEWAPTLGSPGGCACRPCASVIGPSEYFVCLLRWLSTRDVTGGTALSKLLARRPDLEHISLSCDAALTPVRYVDLVGEIATTVVANAITDPDDPLTIPIATTYTADELEPSPEIVHPVHHVKALGALAEAIHPFALPRDLWWEESNVYLGWLGSSRREVIEVLSTATGDALSLELAQAQLGLRDDGWDLLTDAGYSAQLKELWGNRVSPMTPQWADNDAAVAALKDVQTFIKYAGLRDWDELQELLGTQYVNGPAVREDFDPVVSIPSWEGFWTADIGVTVDGSDRITAWADQTEEGADLVVSGTDARKPTRSAVTKNGLALARFDPQAAGGQWVKLATVPSLTAGEAFIVFKADDDPPDNTPSGVDTGGLWWCGPAGAANHVNGTDGVVVDGFLSSAAKTTVNPTPALTEWRLYAVRSASGAWSNWLDGAELFSTGTNTVSNGGGSGLFVGTGASDQSTGFEGYVAGFMLSNALLTTYQRSAFHAWVERKWDLDFRKGAAGLDHLKVSPTYGCVVEDMEIAKLSSAHLLRIHRFLRLARKLDLSLTETDRLVAAFAEETDPTDSDYLAITPELVANLTAALHVGKTLGLSAVEVASLYADLQVHEHTGADSPYRALFLSKLVDAPTIADFETVMDVERTAAGSYVTHRASIQQALGISSADMDLLSDSAALAARLLLPSSQLVVTAASPISLAGLSSLYRHVRLARALKLSVADYLVLRAHAGVTAVGAGAGPNDTERFREIVADFRATKLSVRELQWILRGFDPTGAVAPADADVDALLADVQGAVSAIVEETKTLQDDEIGARALGLLVLLVGQTAADDIHEVLLREIALPGTDTWRPRFDVLEPYFAGTLTALKNLLVGAFSGTQQPAELATAAERLAYVARGLEQHVRCSRAVPDKLAAKLGLPAATVEYLMARVIRASGSTTLFILDGFLPANKAGADDAARRANLLLLYRHARLLNALRLNAPVPPAADASPGELDGPGELAWAYSVPDPTPSLRDLPRTQPGSGDLGVADAAKRFARRGGFTITAFEGLVDDWRHDQGITQSSGLIDAWAGSVNSTALTSSGSDRPAYSTGDTYGSPNFDGNDDYLDGAISLGSNPTFTLFFVSKRAAMSGSSHAWFFATGLHIFSYYTSTDYIQRTGQNVTFGIASDTTRHVAAFVSSPTYSTIWREVSGAFEQRAGGTHSAWTMGSISSVRFGNTNPAGAAGAFQGHHHRVIFLNALLPDEHMHMIGDYLVQIELNGAAESSADEISGGLLGARRRVALRDRMKGGPDAFRAFLEQAPDLSLADAKSLLAETAGWDLTSIDTLVTRFGIASGRALTYHENLRKLDRAVALVGRLGLSVAEAASLTALNAGLPANLETPNSPPNTRDLSLVARRAAKAKLSAEEWKDLAPALRDQSRVQLRDALVSWLVPRVYDDVPALFGGILVDPEMGDCMKTSRVVQGTNSIQVFVQRCLLNLEDFTLDAESAKQWEWMKSYRVWEANRKIFLYPENWIEPELRSDQTPLFKQLARELRQGELTDVSAEKAFARYLDGLHEVSRLEVMATAFDTETETDHVIARTRSTPSTWFYRRRENDRGWTPWEKMDLDVDGESLCARWENRRLYLFWLQTSVVPSNPTSDSPVHQVELRVAWSSYFDGRWSPKKISDGNPVVVRGTNAEGRLVAIDQASGEVKSIFDLKSLNLVASSSAAGVGEVVLDALELWKGMVYPNSPSTGYRVWGRFTFDACGGGRWKVSLSNQQAASAPELEAVAYFLVPLPNAKLANGAFRSSNDALTLLHTKASGGGFATLELLSSAPTPWRVVSPSTTSLTFPFDRFCFEDEKRSLYGRYVEVKVPEWSDATKAHLGFAPPIRARFQLRCGGGDALSEWARQSVDALPVEHVSQRYALEVFHHPYVCDMANRLAAGGPEGLLGWKDVHTDSVQFSSNDLDPTYDFTWRVLGMSAEHPTERVDFTYGSPYGVYNWELFFHVPMLIAELLRKEGRYAEAQRWMHFVFNPMTASDGAAPQRFWKFAPFFLNYDLATIQDDLEALAATSPQAAELLALFQSTAASQIAANDIEKQLQVSAEAPFDPHAIARLRILAYQKWTVMRYIENLQEWGDSLFRRGTMESIHEALQLYLVAVEILGPRPTFVKHEEPPPKTYAELANGLDAFGNAAAAVEPLVPQDAGPVCGCHPSKAGAPELRLYFCVPPNDKLLGYWDLVQDRLFKIRNCLDIEGVAVQIPLFAPPIDPALLVKAAAAGVKLDQILNSLAAPAPMYRFVRVLAKAMELAGAVLDFGRALLGAMEKRDGETLMLLRQTHELNLLDAEREVRTQQIQETKETLAGLQRQRDVVAARHAHYTGLEDWLKSEEAGLGMTAAAGLSRYAAALADGTASILHALPDVTVGPGGGVTSGGTSAGHVATAVGRGFGAVAEALGAGASVLQFTSTVKRRREDWNLQITLATKELLQVDRQIIAQEIRVAIAQQELSNLDLRREQSKEIDAFLRTKFTNDELYDWMVGELAAEHYKAYQLAFDMAKRAEKAFQLEIGPTGFDTEQTFVRFGAWDSLKKGLLAGERLMADLRSMDAAYLTKSVREKEITKHIALSELADVSSGALNAITQLRKEGTTTIALPEALFDADYPGHYFRRIKTVALTLETVKPSRDGVQCEVTLDESKIRLSTGTGTGYAESSPGADTRFRYVVSPKKQLVTSTAEMDAGLFEVNLRDDMLLPFEGNGAIGQWTIDVAAETNRFPLHRIRDAILHVRYTSRDGGAVQRETALTAAGTALTSRMRMFAARHDFEDAWAVFLQGTGGGTPMHQLDMRIHRGQFLSFFGDPAVTLVGVELSAVYGNVYGTTDPLAFNLKLDQTASPGIDLELAIGAGVRRVANAVEDAASFDVLAESDPEFEVCRLEIAADAFEAEALEGGAIKPDFFEELWLTFTYTKTT